MKKFNHPLMASISMLLMTTSLCPIGLTTVAGSTSISFAFGMLHGIVTYKKNQETRLRTMAATGGATVTALTVNDYVAPQRDIVWKAQDMAATTQIKPITSSAHSTEPSYWILANDKYHHTSLHDHFPSTQAAQKHIQQSTTDYIQKSQGIIEQERRDALYFAVPRTALRIGTFMAGDWTGRKLMEIVNKPSAPLSENTCRSAKS